MDNSTPAPVAAGTSPPAVEAMPGPIALAPSMTGVPAPSPAPARPLPPPPARSIAVATPAPPPRPAAAVEIPTPPPTPFAAVGIPTVAPFPCPPGAIAMWSEPDVAGTPVPICRRLSPPQ